MKRRLPEYMVPGALVFLEQLPLTPNGKLDRKALPTPEAQLAPDNIPQPRDGTEFCLQQIWRDVLGCQEVAIEDNFFEIGGHSLHAVGLAGRISMMYKTRMSVRSIFDYPTIEKLAAFLRQNVSPTPPSSVVPLNTRGNLTPLFCVHPSGGMASCYVPLARALGTERPFYALQSTGIDAVSDRFACIEEMASAYVAEVRTVQPEGPYLLGGWSLGGIIAFEMAQQLTARGDVVAILALFDSQPNVEPLQQPVTQDEVRQFAAVRMLQYLAEVGIPEDVAAALTIEQRIELFVSEARKLRRLPSDVDSDYALRILLTWTGNERAAQRYAPQLYSGRISLFKSSHTNFVDSAYGWRRFAAGGVDVYSLPVRHDKFMDESHAKELAAVLNECLDVTASAHAIHS